MTNRKEPNYIGFKWTQNFIKPPLWFLFNASAKTHDDNYEAGGGRMDRMTADVGFLWRMLSDANKQPTLWKKRLAVYTAITYFIAVRLFGWISFKWK